MATDPISATRQSSGAEKSAPAPEKGTFSKYQDGGYDFGGDDKATVRDVAHRILTMEDESGAVQGVAPEGTEARRKQDDAAAQAILNSPENAQLAQQLHQQGGGDDINKAIPSSASVGGSASKSSVRVDADTTLKSLLAAVAPHLEAYKKSLTNPGLFDNVNKMTGHGVQNHGIDPFADD